MHSNAPLRSSRSHPPSRLAGISLWDSSSERYWHAQGGSASFGGPTNVPTGARCHVHVTANCAADAAKPVPDVYAAHPTGQYGAVGGDLLTKAPPPLPAAIFTAAKNKLLDGGGSGAWSPLSPGGTGASAQLAQLLGLFDEQAGGGGLGRSITESSDFILREVCGVAVPVPSHAALPCCHTHVLALRVHLDHHDSFTMTLRCHGHFAIRYKLLA